MNGKKFILKLEMCLLSLYRHIHFGAQKIIMAIMLNGKLYNWVTNYELWRCFTFILWFNAFCVFAFFAIITEMHFKNSKNVSECSLFMCMYGWIIQWKKCLDFSGMHDERWICHSFHIFIQQVFSLLLYRFTILNNCEIAWHNHMSTALTFQLLRYSLNLRIYIVTYNIAWMCSTVILYLVIILLYDYSVWHYLRQNKLET